MKLQSRELQVSFDVARAAFEVDWLGAFASRYSRYGLWFGGWSWLQPPKFLRNCYQFNLCLGFLGD